MQSTNPVKQFSPKWAPPPIDTKFYPLQVGSHYLVRHYSYVSGNPWHAKVEAVTDLCYLINDRWYIRSEFESRYRVFEEIEFIPANTVGVFKTEAKYVTKK